MEKGPIQQLSNGDVQIRVDTRFHEWIREVKQQRLERGIDKIKSSDRYITLLIIRHLKMKFIKEDIINHVDSS